MESTPSPSWLNRISSGDRMIIENLWRTYPRDTTYGSLICAIKHGDINIIRSIAELYNTYIPLRWIHIVHRMLWSDITPSDNMRNIAYIIYGRAIAETSISYEILRSFVFKYESPDMIASLRQIDTSGFSYDGYESTAGYLRFSPEIHRIVNARSHIDIYDTLELILQYNRLDLLKVMYERYHDETIRYLKWIFLSDDSPCLRGEIQRWIESQDKSILQGSILYSRNITGNIYRTDAYDIISTCIDTVPESFDLSHMDAKAISVYLSHRENIRYILDSDRYLEPEIYDIMLRSINRDDHLYWRIISYAIDHDIPEILEKYIISDLDMEKASISITNTNISISRKFISLRWNQFRRTAARQNHINR